MSEKSNDNEPPKLNDEQRQSFRPEKEPELHHFPAGTRFYKHADSAHVGPNYKSAYWSSVEPITLKDGTKTEGAKDVSERYGGDAEKIREHGRYRNAVSHDWNSKMDQRVEIETTKDQWGYVGKANNQPYDKKNAPNVTMMGGDHQVVLPAMKEGDFKYVNKGEPIAGSVAEQKQKNEALAAQRLSQGKVDPTQRPPSPQGPPPPRGPSISSSQGPPPRSSTPPAPSNPDPSKGKSR